MHINLKPHTTTSKNPIGLLGFQLERQAPQTHHKGDSIVVLSLKTFSFMFLNFRIFNGKRLRSNPMYIGNIIDESSFLVFVRKVIDFLHCWAHLPRKITDYFIILWGIQYFDIKVIDGFLSQSHNYTFLPFFINNFKYKKMMGQALKV